ncbi:phage tail-collar fiber domain-containing protein [Paraburkholderia terricola]|uniref:phage tail-collar fiber domain-containing protein n=1 Tax=Paraburkholderia terricola TaxID=169427 RepID=UPI003ECF6016
MPTSTPLQPTITSAGLAAIFNAQSTGVEFVLSHIAFGTGQYTPDGSETALHVEKVRVPIAGGGRISPTQIQIYAIAMAAAGDPFFVGEVGFFGDNGATLLAVYSSTAAPSLFLSDTVSTSVSYALGLAALPAGSVTVTIDPSASAALLLIGNHVAAADPHPQYVEKVNGVAFYDPTLTFNQGAEIIGDDLLVYQSAQAGNINHLPSTSPAWWVPLYNYGDTPVAGLTNANVTLSSTQAARAHITFSGALTANINVVLPNWVKDWTVVNNTTGAFSLTCKTAAGTGVVIPQNASPTKIRGDGTNITQLAENVAQATQTQHAVQFGQVRRRLTANITLYVSPTGSDSNNGLAVGTPFLTLQKAWNTLQQGYDLAGFIATIQLANGTYAAGVAAVGPVVGAAGYASVVFNGSATPSDVNVAMGAALTTCFSAKGGAQFTVTGVTLSSSASGCNGVLTDTASSIGFSNITFGAMPAGAHIYGGNIVATGNYTISGGAGYHVIAQTSGSQVGMQSGITVTLTGTPAFSTYFAYAAVLGAVVVSGVTFSGAATGVRYAVSANGVINTGGASTTFLPGNAAGASNTGGQYV